MKTTITIGRTEHSRYTPKSSEVNDLKELFHDMKLIPFNGAHCKHYRKEEGVYHIHIPNESGWRTGKPCKEIVEWLESNSVYGANCEEVSFDLKADCDGVYRLNMRFSNILGGYALCYTSI